MVVAAAAAAAVAVAAVLVAEPKEWTSSNATSLEKAKKDFSGWSGSLAEWRRAQTRLERGRPDRMHPMAAGQRKESESTVATWVAVGRWASPHSMPYRTRANVLPAPWSWVGKCNGRARFVQGKITAGAPRARSMVTRSLRRFHRAGAPPPAPSPPMQEGLRKVKNR